MNELITTLFALALVLLFACAVGFGIAFIGWEKPDIDDGDSAPEPKKYQPADEIKPAQSLPDVACYGFQLFSGSGDTYAAPERGKKG